MNIPKKGSTVFLALLLLFCSNSRTGVYGQGAKELAQSLKLYQQKYPAEGVYLHTDRTMYSPGDQIEYMAYMVAGTDYQSGQLSHKLYVKLFDIDGLEISADEYNIEQNNLAGTTDIPKYAVSGEYLLVAYTDRMENKPADNVFCKIISVTDKEKDKLRIKILLDQAFYLSGSSLKADLEFRGIDSLPVPASYTYRIKNAKEKIVEGKWKAGNNGSSGLTLTLPDFAQGENLELFVDAGYKGTDSRAGIVIPSADNYIDVSFFPEGGRLIYGLNSKVAFRSFNIVNRPVDFKGELIDNNNNSICTISGTCNGTGSFRFTPASGKTYFLRITEPAGLQKTFALPEPLLTGLNLSLAGESGATLALLMRKAGSGPSLFNYIMHTKGHLLRAESITVKDSALIKIPLNDVPPGISEIAVFDSKSILVAKRLVYLNDTEKLNINLKAAALSASNDGSIELEIETSDGDGKSLGANLSLSAAGKEFQDEFPDNNSIRSWFNLRNDLIVYLPTPGYYSDSLSGSDLDNLLIANSYRGFSWRNVLSFSKDEVSYNNGIEKESSEVNFLTDLRRFAVRELTYSKMSPGSSFMIQGKNKRAEKSRKNSQEQADYSGYADIFSLLAQIEPYHLVNNKIVFTKIGPNTTGVQDGALIVINGSLMGEDPSILKEISPKDIARINISTNFIDIQKYSGFNTTGIIEVYTKSGQKENEQKQATVIDEEADSREGKKNNLKKSNHNQPVFWNPDIHTDSSGKAKVIIDGFHFQGPVRINVEGISGKGLPGSASIYYNKP
jgi:hypothetical protein